jgi:lipopolysaccharide export system ATP-binding protein
VNQGSVIAAGTADEILANPQVREVYLGQDFRM